MTDSDALLHETNRAAHKVARALGEWRVRWDEMHPAQNRIRKFAMTQEKWIPVENALDAYEEAERRAQSEATR